ncbi:MAG: copper-containing nitrite reductase [Acidobacteriota bacterium]|nr:copper-containing nitrite reductase [Acidobacteriota bacterium]MDQ5871334.1 copper-containing nitrite reductase [Acidobacteriota bacterium]
MNRDQRSPRARRVAALAILLAPLSLLPACRRADVLKAPASPISYAPEVPSPIDRKSPARIVVEIDSNIRDIALRPGVYYKAWTFNGTVPGPFIRTRVGDTLEVGVTNSDPSGMPHNIDFHAVLGPGGGADVTTITPGQRKVAEFKLMFPGVYVYHCAAPPVTDHIANGMYGLILVEPKGGLPRVDREFYIVQSEFYTTSAMPPEGSRYVEYSHAAGLREDPEFVVFNGSSTSLLGHRALEAKTGETVRIFLGNAGPNLISSFHVIGEIFERVFREGDLVSPPARFVQSTLVPAGGSTVVEFQTLVPGRYILVDHAIFRTEKGAAGHLNVIGKPRPDIYKGTTEPGQAYH